MSLNKKGKVLSFQMKYENLFVTEKLKGFDPYQSEAWKELSKRYGEKISHNAILSLAEVISHHLQIGLYREYKRRKEMLIKWFDENLNKILPFLDYHLTVIDTKCQVF